MAFRAGRLALTAAALACAAAVAGCASSGSSQPGASGSTAAASPTAQGTTPGSSNTPAVAAPSSSPAAAGPPACPTSSLQVKQGVSQGYAGGVYVVIDFTNTSAQHVHAVRLSGRLPGHRPAVHADRPGRQAEHHHA